MERFTRLGLADVAGKVLAGRRLSLDDGARRDWFGSAGRSRFGKSRRSR